MRFTLDPDEARAFNDWNAQHMREHHSGIEPYGGAIGGRISFVITGTSIGRLLSVQCNACAHKPDAVRSCLLTDAASL